MIPRLLNSLGFQISLAFLVLLALFGGATLYTFFSLQQQHANDMVLNLAAKLQLTAQHLATQGMNYKQNAPRDYPTYYRDVRLYYQDLTAHVRTFEQIYEGFMHEDFQPELTGVAGKLNLRLDEPVRLAIQRLEATWTDYRDGLYEALGPDLEEPRLEYAAEHAIAQHRALEAVTEELEASLSAWAEQERQRITQINALVILSTGVFGFGLVAWLFSKVLAPLQRTMEGFRRVAQGDFGHQLQVEGSSELRELITSFNQLSARLNVLFKLTDRLQAGNDLAQVLGYLSREFPDLLRIDWIGILFVAGDGSTARLESSYLDGKAELVSRQLFRLQGTLLEQALVQGAPLHIENMERAATLNRRYHFLRTLIARGLRDSIFLPLTEQSQSPIPAVLVFATRRANSYDEAQLAFLNNIAQLITHSFGRTVKLAEHGRLAAIGEFASGIAHELRNPLATIGLALDYFSKLDLPEGGRKRARLAAQEANRTNRLLEEMLLYAKPLQMRLKPMSLIPALAEFLEAQQALAQQRAQRFGLVADAGTDIQVMGDADRLAQIWLNLARNACEAAPAGASISWSVRDQRQRGAVQVEVHNPGPAIPAEVLPRITEPFFSTKPAGTGLGLAIVKRLVSAHGGDVGIASDPTRGTRVTVTLPRLD